MHYCFFNCMESESYVTLFLVIKPSKNSFNLNTARIKHGYPFVLIDTWWSAQNVRNGITECVKMCRKSFL